MRPATLPNTASAGNPPLRTGHPHRCRESVGLQAAPGRVLLFAAICLLTIPLSVAASRNPSVQRLLRDQVRSEQQQAKDRDADTRHTAILTLALLAGESWEPRSFEAAGETLIRAIDDEDPDVGQAASAALEALVETDTLPTWAASILDDQLSRALKNRRIASRLFAARCLLQAHPMHTDATQTLVDLLESRKPDVRSETINALPRLWRSNPPSLNGTVADLLRSRLGGLELDRSFDAARALWLLGQRTGDAATVTESEAVIARALVTTRSVDLVNLLDACISTFRHPPALPPGNLLPAALLRCTEDQPPETSLRAAVALALLNPPGHELNLARRFHQLLPGYLTHASPSVRIGTANAVGYYAPRLSLGSLPRTTASGETTSTASVPWAIDPEFRQVLTNLFGVPDPQAQLRAVSRLSLDPTYVNEHPEALAHALVEGLSFANLETLQIALAPALDSVWALPETQAARTIFLRNLPLWEGVRCRIALRFLRRSADVFNAGALTQAVLAQAQSEATEARLAAATTLLDWIGREDGAGRLPPEPALACLVDLAGDSNPLVALGGFACLSAGTAGDNLPALATACRETLSGLLQTGQRADRCRFVSLAAGTPQPLNRQGLLLPAFDPSRAPPPHRQWFLDHLERLLTDPDPDLQTKTQHAIGRF